MKRTFHLHFSDNMPKATISNQWIWDLVEYLSILGIRVTYAYSANRFVVSFPRMNLNQAREMLADWAESQAPVDRVAAGHEMCAGSAGIRELAGQVA